jgi:hypothetical protein
VWTEFKSKAWAVPLAEPVLLFNTKSFIGGFTDPDNLIHVLNVGESLFCSSGKCYVAHGT